MKKKSLVKKIMVSLAAAGLCLTSLSGCGSSEKSASVQSGAAEGISSSSEQDTSPAVSGEPVTIRVCWWGNQTRNDGTVKALDMYKAEHPNVKFEVEFSDWTGYWDKLSTQTAGGNMPDIIQMDYAYIRQYAEKNQLTGLNEYISGGVIDTGNIADTIIGSGKIDGEVYGICSGIQSKALLVNKGVMEECGVTLPEQPTWEELFDAAKTIYEKTGIQLEIPSNDEQSMLFLARAVGQTMYNEAGDALGMPDDKVALRYFTMLKDTLNEGFHVSPEAMAEASTNQQSLFAAGKEWCAFMNSNQITDTISKCEEGLEYDILMYPTEKDAAQQPLFLKPSMFYSIAKDSKNPETAADVINYLTNSVEANKEALKGERGVPVSGVVSEAIAPVVDSSTAKINEYVTKVSSVATAIDPPFPPASAEIGKNISDLADMVRYEEISPEDAAAKFYETATELLKKRAQS